jgi:hypothetical protein
VPWVAVTFGVELEYLGLSVGDTLIISALTAYAKVCDSSGNNCRSETVGNAGLTPAGAMMLIGAIFQLVGATQLVYIAAHLRKLSFTGAPTTSAVCCHNPAVQGFSWTGWVLNGIGASYAGALFGVVQLALKTPDCYTGYSGPCTGYNLDPAPGGVMEAFVVVVGLVGCIIAAVLNCNITGVTGVGQSTSNCCCAQEAKSENAPSGSLGGFGLPGVTVVMTSPLQQLQQQQQIGITTNAWPPPPPSSTQTPTG